MASALALAAAAVPLAEARAEEVLPPPKPTLRDGDTERPPLLEAVALPSALAVPSAVSEGAAAEGVSAEVAEPNCEKVGGATVDESEGLAASVREAVAVALPVEAAERVPSPPPLCVAEALPSGVPVTSGEEVTGASETLALALLLRKPLAEAQSEGAATVLLAHAVGVRVPWAVREADVVASLDTLAVREGESEAVPVAERECGALAVWEGVGLAVGVKGVVALAVCEGGGVGVWSPVPELLAVAAPVPVAVPVAPTEVVAQGEGPTLVEPLLLPVPEPFAVEVVHSPAVGDGLLLRAPVALAADADAHAVAASGVELGQRLGDGVPAGEAEGALAVPGREGVAPLPQGEGKGDALIIAEELPLAEGGCETQPLAVDVGLPESVAGGDGVGGGLGVPTPLFEASGDGVRGGVAVEVADCAPLLQLLAVGIPLPEPRVDTVASALNVPDDDAQPLAVRDAVAVPPPVPQGEALREAPPVADAVLQVLPLPVAVGDGEA